jgi:hypothetical protein
MSEALFGYSYPNSPDGMFYACGEADSKDPGAHDATTEPEERDPDQYVGGLDQPYSPTLDCAYPEAGEPEEER